MRLSDLLRLALDNLRRNRTRTLLTLSGVTVGAAALLALLAYGSGLQRNAQAEFDAVALFNTLRVTSTPNPLSSVADLAYRTTRADTGEAVVPLTDSVLARLDALPGVLAAFPELVFPVEVRRGDREVIANAEAVPTVFGTLAPYRAEAGSFFASDADSTLMITPSMARRLGYQDPAAAVGDTLALVTATLRLDLLQRYAQAVQLGLATLPIRRVEHPLRVAGLLPEEERAVGGFFRVLLPMETARGMRKITFFSTLDLLLRSGPVEGYGAARVQLVDGEPATYAAVRDSVRAAGLHVTSFREQFARLDRLFVVLDLALGIVGLIALLVATLGIANTMMMNVMERTREIGVMKALGGEERDLQTLFVIESGVLGLAGGALGLVLGWALTLAIDLGVGAYLRDLGVPAVSVFHIGPAMLVGVAALTLLVSLVAGLAPARRAARIDPLVALRTA